MKKHYIACMLILYLATASDTFAISINITQPAIPVPGLQIPDGHYNQEITYISSDAQTMFVTDWLADGVARMSKRTRDPQTLQWTYEPEDATKNGSQGESLSPDGTTLFYGEYGDIYRCTYLNGQRSSGQLIVSTEYPDNGPSFNEKELYFHTWYNDIYVSTYDAVKDTFSTPVSVSINTTEYSEFMPWISYDGLFLVFASDRPGGYGGLDLWYSSRTALNQDWSAPINFGPNVNTAADERVGKIAETAGLLFFDRASNVPYTIMQVEIPEPTTLLLLGLGGLLLRKRSK